MRQRYSRSPRPRRTRAPQTYPHGPVSSSLTRVNRTVTIVGAGISGLAAGRALLDDGWDVRIYERADAPPQTGTSLVLWFDALEELDASGLGDPVRAAGIQQDEARFLTPEGKTFATIRPQQPNYVVSRPALHNALISDELAARIQWGTHITGPGQLPPSDLIIAADGINSVFRHAVVGRDHPAEPLGTVALRGVVPGPATTSTETWGKGRLFGITPYDAHNTNWFACLRQDELDNAYRRTTRDTLAALFHGWHDDVQSVIERIDESAVDIRPLSDVRGLMSVYRDNTVLIGDAAHAMAPNLGRGASEALLDAAALAMALQTPDGLDTALAEYDRLRRNDADGVAQVSRYANRLVTGRRFGALRRGVVKLGAWLVSKNL